MHFRDTQFLLLLVAFSALPLHLLRGRYRLPLPFARQIPLQLLGSGSFGATFVPVSSFGFSSLFWLWLGSFGAGFFGSASFDLKLTLSLTASRKGTSFYSKAANGMAILELRNDGLKSAKCCDSSTLNSSESRIRLANAVSSASLPVDSTCW